tara:strand:+ start:7 stop:186 length:180 start_codon:yes stop_codon:yes gene_type:complete
LIFGGNEIHIVQSTLFIYNSADYMMTTNPNFCDFKHQITMKIKGLELNSKGDKENVWQS